jgi:hypothetical protein
MRVVVPRQPVRPRAHQAVYPPAAQAPRRRRRWPWTVGVVGAVLALLVVAAFTTSFGTGLHDGFQKGFSGTTAAPQTANQVVATLTAKIPTAKLGAVYTADSDPNHLLGRPNGYTSKATFTDRRVAAGPGITPGSVDAGGAVEVFADADSAQRRQQYIQGLQKASPILGTEYDYISGATLVRVSGKLAPTQAGEYQAALSSS